MKLKKTSKGLTLALSPSQSTQLTKAASGVGYTPAQFISHVLAECIKSAQESARVAERLAVAPSS